MLTHKLPDIKIVSASNFKGMLRIVAQADDKASQYIANCVTFSIERDSAKTCEFCGRFGRRKTFLLPDGDIQLCLCHACYTLELDRIISNTPIEQ